MQLVRVDRKQGISDTAKYSIEKDGGKKSCSKKRQLFSVAESSPLNITNPVNILGKYSLAKNQRIYSRVSS